MNGSFLKSGQKIGVFAPSSYVETSDIEAASALMRDRGFDVFVHPQTFARENQSAGSHAEKLAALHDIYGDDTVDVIWAAGGGNRSLHLLDGVDYDLIAAHPKPMVGFSDVTALLNVISAKTGIVNIHGPVFKNLPKHRELDVLLAGDFEMPLDDAKVLRSGEAQGRAFGGNLSVFQYLLQDFSEDLLKGAILFLEDCNEELSRIDRMMCHLKRSGVFDSIGGLVLGEFDLSDSGRPFGFALEDIVKEHVGHRDIPIILNAPFGHGDTLFPFPVGGHVHLNDNMVRLIPSAVDF